MKLIDKSALVAEIKRLRDTAFELYGCSQFDSAYNNVLKSIDTLEVKEVDLEKEIEEEYLKRRQWGGKLNMLVILNEPQFNEIAKHFFELGLALSNKDIKEKRYERNCKHND